MTVGDEQLRNRQTNAGARARKKNSFHDLENDFGSRDALRVATTLIPILTNAPMQECPARAIAVLCESC